MSFGPSEGTTRLLLGLEQSVRLCTLLLVNLEEA